MADRSNKHTLEDNPFISLFGSIRNVEQFKNNYKTKFTEEAEGQNNIIMPIQDGCIHASERNPSESEPTLLEQLLLVSTRTPNRKFTYVYMADVPELTEESVDIVLFERLLLDNAKCQVQNLKENPSFNDEKLEVVGRNEVVLYLFDVYERCWKYRSSENDTISKVKSSVITNLCTALEQPEIFNGQNPERQLQDLIFNSLSNSTCLENFISKLLDESKGGDEIPFKLLFTNVLSRWFLEFQSCSLMNINWNLVAIIDFYASSPILASLLIQYLPEGDAAKKPESTVLGHLLSISCLPKHDNLQFEFFDQPSKQTAQIHKRTEQSIGIAQNALNNRTYKIFMSLLKVSPKVKDSLLKWIEACLELNSGKTGLWYIHGQAFGGNYVSDGFMVNLGAVMLKLSAPFCKDILDSQTRNLKILKVDPLYCCPSLTKEPDKVAGLYSGDLPKQTTLIPPKEDFEVEKSVKLPAHFSFITTCFFQTHRALNLGIQVLFQKLFKLSREMGLLQQEYQELQDPTASEMMKNHMELKTSLFLSYKAAAFETTLVDDMLQFLASTAVWLGQVAITPSDKFYASSFREPCLTDLDSEKLFPNSLLCYVPEMIVENVIETIIAIRRYNLEALTLCGEPVLYSFMGFIIMFMGSPHWMNNPHLRAHLAECLESFIAKNGEAAGLFTRVNEKLLTEHPLSKHLVTAIIHVFVSIEMTGQNVSFEEKFNYRRPMYDIMKHLWDIPVHRKQFVHLASFALSNMESAKPPLFLRFVNLLMNDAIFLLDEGLMYMTQIREHQIQRDAGDFSQPRREQGEERERNMQQMGFLAKFHNMLGSKTIQTLVRLTEVIPTMFTHPTLISRMAAMLNYFLLHLVGPKQRNLKVRDMEKYEFRPADIVTDICTIYINLSKQTDFAIAVSGDDRSYSPDLFNQACIVLIRIGRYSLKEELEAFSLSVREACKKKIEDEDLASSAPEEFIDPIMSQLMMDPVTLPSSRIVVDRQTIARHLLSDQTDPFNRQPLTMEEIIPNEDLKNKIHDWLSKKEKVERVSKRH